ncbi:MAG: ABC transporter permease [Chloroflexi bacterium]|nr:ABC transporter permease [Chloroflexota bacterium]
MSRFLDSPTVRSIARVVLATTAALLLGFVITWLVSDDPIGAYKALLLGPVSRLNRFGDWIEESITLTFLGLAVALVFKAEQFSLGQEGQMVLGALVAGVVSLFVPLPAYFRIPLALLAAMTAGFLWGLIPGYLKAYLDANEIVSTLMLNVLAVKFYEYLLTYYIKPPNAGYTTSEKFPVEGVLPSFFPPIPGLENLRRTFVNQTNISVALYLLIVATIVVYYLMYRTPFGYELRMVGANIKFARYGGINTKRVIMLSMAISGILAGLAGAHLAMGIHRKLILNIQYGLGFEGIVVAILARNNPLAIPFTALAYGYLRAGADVMERTSDVSREMVLVIQGVIILLVTAERILPVVQKRVRARRGEDEDGAPPETLPPAPAAAEKGED